MGAGCGRYSSKSESNGKVFARCSPCAMAPAFASVPGLLCISGRNVPHDGQLVLCSMIFVPHCTHTIISRLFPVLWAERSCTQTYCGDAINRVLHSLSSIYVPQCITNHFQPSSFAHYW